MSQQYMYNPANGQTVPATPALLKRTRNKLRLISEDEARRRINGELIGDDDIPLNEAHVKISSLEAEVEALKAQLAERNAGKSSAKPAPAKAAPAQQADTGASVEGDDEVSTTKLAAWNDATVRINAFYEADDKSGMADFAKQAFDIDLDKRPNIRSMADLCRGDVADMLEIPRGKYGAPTIAQAPTAKMRNEAAQSAAAKKAPAKKSAAKK